MQLCAYRPDGGDDAGRLGVLLLSGDVLDAHLTHVTWMAGHLPERRAYQIGVHIVPPSLDDFLMNGRHGWIGLADALEGLGASLDTKDLCGPEGERLRLDGDEVALDDLVDPTGAAGRVCVVVLCRPALAIHRGSAWDHIGGFVFADPGDARTHRVLHSASEAEHVLPAALREQVADAVAGASRSELLRPGDTVAVVEEAGEVIDLVAADQVVDLTGGSPTPATGLSGVGGATR